MGFDVEKVNGLLASQDFVSKLKADLSDEGIVKTFGNEGISLTKEDAQGFKQHISRLYKLSDEQLNVSGGKISIEKGIHDVFSGVGHVVGGAAKGVGTVAGGIAKGVGTVAGGAVKGVGKVAKGIGYGVGNVTWGAIEVVGSAVQSLGKGIYDGVKDA